MASNKDYLTFVLEQLSDLDGISYRAMMGEYISFTFEEKSSAVSMMTACL